MDIIVKSFNRPYYLDRCLQSIHDFIPDFNGTVFVTDDGTPARFLEKIQQKHPFVKILKSEFYQEKSAAVAQKNAEVKSLIPIDLWCSTAQKASDFFLILEDDNWFFQAVNWIQLQKELQLYHPEMVKLMWFGNAVLIPSKTTINGKLLALSNPKVFTLNPDVYTLIFKNNFLKIRTILDLFGCNTVEKELAYYSIYAASGAVYQKEHFLKLWKSHNHTIDEKLQIINTLQNCNRDSLFGRSQSEWIKNGYISSASNSQKQYDNVSLNMNDLNALLNAAWYNEDFITTADFSKDITVSDVERTIKIAKNESVTVSEWQKWHTAFKKQYEDFGCKTD